MGKKSAPKATLAEGLVKHGLFLVNTAFAHTDKPVFPEYDWDNELYETPPNAWFRWNLLWFVFFCLIFVPLPLWLYPVTCVGGYLASVVVTVWMCLVLFFCMIYATSTMAWMYKCRTTTWLTGDPMEEVLLHTPYHLLL